MVDLTDETFHLIGEKELKEMTSFVYAHYNLTPAEALKYLHRHQGCQSVEK